MLINANNNTELCSFTKYSTHTQSYIIVRGYHARTVVFILARISRPSHWRPEAWPRTVVIQHIFIQFRWPLKIIYCMKTVVVVFYSTRCNPGIYLAILFYQPGWKIGHFFYPSSKKEWLGIYARVTPGRIKNTTSIAPSNTWLPLELQWQKCWKYWSYLNYLQFTW